MIGWAFLIKSKLAQWIAVAVSAIVAILTFGQLQKRKGRKEERRKAKEADNENAAEIRDRVERDLPDRVRDFDDAGFRDE